VPFSPLALFWFVVHCIIAFVIFKILEIVFVWLGGQIHLDLLVQLATWLALLIALLYLSYWYWWRPRTVRSA
jgi:hypothetical protein